MTYLTSKILHAYIIKNNKNFIVVKIIYVKMYFQVANIKKNYKIYLILYPNPRHRKKKILFMVHYSIWYPASG